MKGFSKTRWCLFLGVGLVSGLFSLSPMHLSLEQMSGLRQLFKSRGYLSPPKEIAIVAISNAVSKQLNYPPHVVQWSRAAYAELIDTLNEGGAALVVLDIAFKRSRPGQDQILAEAMGRAGNVIVFKYLKRNHTPLSLNEGGFLDIEQQVLPPKIVLDNALGAASFTLPKMPGAVVTAPVYMDLGNGEEATQPLMAFLEYYRQAVTSLAQAASLEGVPMDKPLGTKPFHHRAMALRRALLEDQSLAEKLEIAAIKNASEPVQQEHLEKVLRVLQRESKLHINFYGPNRTLNIIPMDKFFATGTKPDVENKIVLVGASETAQTEQFDVYQTVYRLPSGVDVSGVEISATVLANLLYENDLHWLTPVQRSLISILFVTLVFITFFYFRPLLALMVQTLVIIAYYQLALWFFSQKNVWLPLALPLITVFIANISALYVSYLASRKRHKHVLNALSHYLPDNVAHQLSREVIELEKQHKLVQGVCLMTDLQGYTRVSESLPPRELHQKLNRYYETLIDVVNEHGGSVANIVGDSLLAIWTGPLLNEALCLQAYNAACAIMKQTEQADDKGIQLLTSIALHGGEFSLGNLGGRNHFEYSPVGDIVNTTSRIEQLNRKLGTKLLCTSTINTLLPKLEMRYLGNFSLKNKTRSVALYENGFEVVGQDLSQLRERNRLFKFALDKFEHQSWDDAKKLFENVLIKYPEDGPAIYYINQCQLKSASSSSPTI